MNRFSKKSQHSRNLPSKEVPQRKYSQKQLEHAVTEKNELKKLEELEAGHNAHQQNITKLRSCDTEPTETGEHKTEMWSRDLEQMKECIADLEATIKKNKWEQEREKAMKEKESASEKIFSYIMANKTECEKERKKPIEDGKHLKKTAQQVTDSTSALGHQKLDSHPQTTNKLQKKMKYCINKNDTAKPQRDKVIKGQEQLEKPVATSKGVKMLNMELCEFLAIYEDTKKNQEDMKKRGIKAKYKVKQLVRLFGNLTPVLQKREVGQHIDFRNAFQHLSTVELENAMKILDEQEATGWSIQYAAP
ncbi:hypothetical protein C0J50_0029 [Silurus asotus]|uniref:Uncharacterized protein n=1 Tax=Silurus asotus TaxID=30991 RepID=A0AAD4ZZA8_SILAS|nr:hypothetical protein C0J50_0029 [Silurus asotus]